MTEKEIQLAQLHDAVNKCRVCEASVPNFSKPARMNRGAPGDVVIIGESPGTTEVETQAAFSGPSGRRLNEWLVGAGAPAEDPRRGVYLTSVVKCRSEDKPSLSRMAKNCVAFLRQQVDIITPKLIITLGQFAYDALVTQLRWRDAVCRMYESSECWLVSPFRVPFKLMVWPHPSGLSQWINDPEHQRLLEDSFALVRYVRSALSQESDP